MRRLNQDLIHLCRRHKTGAFATRANRQRGLQVCADDLEALGFRLNNAKGLKPKHVEALVAHWKDAGLAPGTLKNRLCWLRFWAEASGKAGMIPAKNDDLGIPKRQVNDANKALELDAKALERVEEPFVQHALMLQQAFGLRREEALKLEPKKATKYGHIHLTKTKGNRPRAVPITSNAQRRLLQEVKAFAGDGSLIPAGLRYVDALAHYRNATRRAGLQGLHGLRHAYAQRRYEALSGLKAPFNDPAGRRLTKEEQIQDRSARLAVSEELGHGRLDVTTVYLGRRK